MTYRRVIAVILIVTDGLLTRVVALGAQANKSFPIQIAGATADGLTLTTSVPHLSRVLMLEGDTVAEVRNARLAVSPLLAPDGTEWPLQPTVAGGAATAPFTIPLAGTVLLKLEADLPVADTYSGVITFIYDGRRKSVPLTVKRTRPKLPVEILGLAGIGTQSSFLNTSGREFWIVLQDTLGKAVTIFPPTLTSLSIGEPGKLRGQAAFNGTTVETEAGDSINSSLTLEDGRMVRLKLRVPELGPGAYVGVLRLSAPNMQPVDKELTILVKYCGLAATFAIAFGVFASYMLRGYNKYGRPRLVLRQRTGRLARSVASIRSELSQLSGGLTPAETSVLDHLNRRLQALDEDVVLRIDQNADPVLTEIDGKLPQITEWVNLRRRVEVLEPPEVAETFRPIVYALHTQFLADISTPEAVAKIKTDITRIADEIDPAIAKSLRTLLTDFDDQVKAQQQLPLVNAETKARLEREVREPLKEAGDALKENLAHAAELIAIARAAYAVILADRLKALLNSVAAQPPNRMDQATWDALRSRTTAQLDEVSRAPNAEAKVASYEGAFSNYFRALVATLRELIAAHVKALDKPGKTADDEAKIAAWKNADRGLDDALAELTLKHLAAATQKYSDAAADVETLEPGALGAVMGTAGVGSAPGKTPLPGAVPAGVPQQREAERGSSRDLVGGLAEVTSKLVTMDRTVAVAIGAIAVASGLNLLWIPNPSWGGVGDWFVALLWGLGLHQVGGAAFEGIAGLTERFK